MSNKTIAKFRGFVILVSLSSIFALSCSHASSNDPYAGNSAELSMDYEKPITVGKIESNDVTESSGIAASLCQPDVFWTHNDNGDAEFIFAFNRSGKHLGIWRVTNAENDDWEDIAAFKDASGTCYLYIGDTGNNDRDRSELEIYRVREPVIGADGSSSNSKNPLNTEPAEVAKFKYPDTPLNSETMMVRPQTGDVYVLTKRVDGPSLVFKIVPKFGSVTQAEKVGEVALPAVPNGLLTGGSISPDAKHIILCDYSAGYELSLGDATNFDDIWKRKPVKVDLGDRKQGEAVTFSADGRSILATSEKKNSPIIEAKRKS